MMIKLNLIPAEKKEGIKKANHFKLVLKWEAELLGILLIFAAMLLSVNYILKITSGSDIQAGIIKNLSQSEEMKKYDSEVRDINKKISEIEKIQKGQLNWFNFFRIVNNQFSNNIEMERIATNNYFVLLSGRANNRDNLISFKEILEKEECFEEVSLPLSSLVERENVEFEINFKIKKECLK